MSKRPKIQWVKNASHRTYLTNINNPESPTKVLHPLNKEHSNI